MGCGASTATPAEPATVTAEPPPPPTVAEDAKPPAAAPAPTEPVAGATPPPAEAATLPPHVTVIMYDFNDKDHGDAWYKRFLDPDAEDGWLVTAAAPGNQVCKLYKAVDSDTKYGWYEEWDKPASQTAYTKHRFATGFLTKWLGLEGSPPSMTALKPPEDFVGGIAVEQGILVKTTELQGKPAVDKTYCVTTKLVFNEQSDCDAFVTGFAESEDGFKATAGASGCFLLKFFKAIDNAVGWAPPTNWTTAFAGLYEEWESKEAFEANRATRDEAMVKWLGEAGAKLKGGKPMVEEYVMGISSIMGKSDLAD